jgi:L-aspartate oxidase
VSEELDLLVLGSGVAGLSAAVRAAADHELVVGVLTKGELSQATTRWAQGGVAAALSEDPEELDLHLADTLAAGAGLCDLDAVRMVVDEGPRRVEELIALGAEFDRDERGRLALAREGGHSVARVVHAGVATGAEIERALVDAVRRSAAVVHEHAFATDLVVDGGRCVGVRVLRDDGTPDVVRARHVLVATGGSGQLFAVTTNPVEATGDGVAMALRAGVAVADLEFFQFHPTALVVDRMPRPLLSEALRGHGALLRGANGERFVDELLPRDVVSRAILARTVADGTDHVWLDVTGLDHFAERFPNIAADLARAGLDPTRDLLPVAPAAHHQCGGIVVDLHGATSLAGLWAAGEVTCSGVHGANRLASNSLLEGMVFGPRAVEAIAAGRDGPSATGAMRAVLGFPGGAPGPDSLDIAGIPLSVPLSVPPPVGEPVVAGAADAGTPDPDGLRRRLQRSMAVGAGVLRDGGGLRRVSAEVGSVAAAAAAAVERLPPGRASVAARELVNLCEVARVLVAAATERTESRGTHARVDHPDADDGQRHRLVATGARVL